MANYNTFLVVDCKTKNPLLNTSSARKAYKELRVGVRIEVWNNNILVERIYESDKRNGKNPLAAYIQSEREYIAKKQAKAEERNRKRKAARLYKMQKAVV